jgi:hypothetical protein
MRPTQGSSNPDGAPQRQFCVLKYRRRGGEDGAPILVVVILDREGSLEILTHSDWRNLVEPIDAEYIDSLFLDFKQRATHHPEELFEQLCWLGVGPLVTIQAGESISDHPALLELCDSFLPL